MFNKIKNYKLILINKDDASAKEFNSKRLVIFSILSLLTLFVFGAIFFSSNQINDFISLKSIHKHKKNNVKLQKLIEGQQCKINDLMVEIDELNKRDDNMRSLLKLPVIDKDIRKLGVGGSSNNDEDLNSLEYLLPTEVHLKSLKDDIEFLLRTINLEKFSYSEIEEKIYKDQDKLLHYPAIRKAALVLDG